MRERERQRQRQRQREKQIEQKRERERERERKVSNILFTIHRIFNRNKIIYHRAAITITLA